MKVVDKFDFPSVSPGQSVYKWDEIFSAKVDRGQLGKPGPAVVLEEGKDFDKREDVKPFLSMIRNTAAKHHLLCKAVLVQVKGKPNTVYVQVAPMTDAEAAEADAKIEKQKADGKKKRLEKKANEVTTPSAPHPEPVPSPTQAA